MKIQIVTDSTAYLTKEEIEIYDIKVVELQVTFEGEERPEGHPGDFDDFFKKLETSKDFPTTSQPSPGAFAEVYERAIDEGKEVLAITLSSRLSGTYNSAVLGADMVDSEKITVIDSLSSAGNLKHMVIKAQKMASEGKTRMEISEYVEGQKKRMGICLTVETLDYLEKGGRLSSAQALIGSILNVRPIIKLEEGVLDSVGKVRGKRNAIKAMIKNVPENVKNIYIPHVMNELEAEEIKKELEEKFPKAEIELTVLGPVIGAHLGPKGIGVSFIW